MEDIIVEDILVIKFTLVGKETLALKRLAFQELRAPKDQALFMLREELNRRGLLNNNEATHDAKVLGCLGMGMDKVYADLVTGIKRQLHRLGLGPDAVIRIVPDAVDGYAGGVIVYYRTDNPEARDLITDPTMKEEEA